jgi:hypothetical protein
LVHLPPAFDANKPNLHPNDVAHLRRNEIGRRFNHFSSGGSHPNTALFTGGEDQNIVLRNWTPG